MFFTKRKLIGLDIGSRYIKVVQLNDTRAGHELALFDLVPLPPDVISDGLIADREQLVAGIKELFKKVRIKTGDAVLGVSGHSSVIIKRITLPFMTEDELSGSMRYEAEQYIPFDINDVNLDFQILGPKKGDEGQMEVVLVAVKRSVVDDYADVARRAGLDPVIVDVDSFALSNMYELNYGPTDAKNVALVNVGASTTNINILQDGMPFFTRDSAIGSNHHTDALQKTLNLTREDAEKAKRGFAVEGIAQGDAQAVINHSSHEIFAEIYRSFEYFRSSVSDEEVDKIVLSGGAAMINEFSSLMGERIGIPVEVANPFRKIEIPGKMNVDFVNEMAPIAAVAVGLALRREGDR
jgi:type IV pilus assembly protein PilM